MGLSIIPTNLKNPPGCPNCGSKAALGLVAMKPFTSGICKYQCPLTPLLSASAHQVPRHSRFSPPFFNPMSFRNTLMGLSIMPTNLKNP